MANIQHNALTSVHRIGHVSSSDPGAVGAYHVWVDTSVTPPRLKLRGAANSFWVDIGTMSDDLNHIATLTPSNTDLLQRVGSNWANRTLAQVKSDLALNLVPNVDATSRGNHTGTQPTSTISDFNSVTDGRIALGLGSANIYAYLLLDESAKVSTLGNDHTYVEIGTDPSGMEMTFVANDKAVARISAATNTFADSPGSPVASATTIIPTGNKFHVTGTTGITSISTTGVNDGTEIMLIFDGVLTVTNGSNLKLAGNFTTSAWDSLCLKLDGSNWVEKGRSSNN